MKKFNLFSRVNHDGRTTVERRSKPRSVLRRLTQTALKSFFIRKHRKLFKTSQNGLKFIKTHKIFAQLQIYL